jgi:hypothetical protein
LNSDHHTAYLTRALSELTPEGRERAEQLMVELTQAANNHACVVQFARDRDAELKSGHVGAVELSDPTLRFSEDELDEVTAGFMEIRDEEPLDDVSDWANAVLELLSDERHRYLG